MEEKLTGIEFLKEYRAHPEKYLPLIDRQYKHFNKWEDEIIRNLNQGAGVGCNNQLYFVERYDVFFSSLATIFISTEGLKDWDTEFTEQFLFLFLAMGTAIRIQTERKSHNRHPDH